MAKQLIAMQIPTLASNRSMVIAMNSSDDSSMFGMTIISGGMIMGTATSDKIVIG